MMETIFWRKVLLGVASLLVVVASLEAAEQRSEDLRDAAIPSGIFDYVARPESVFQWSIRETRSLDTGTLYDVDLTSQQWKGIVWKHVLHVHEPRHIEYPRHVLLFVSGGTNDRRPREGEVLLGQHLANLCGARVAMLFQVPNQPLLDGRREDDLISETWLRFLETGDLEWPLLFPMVKSAVKAMDAIQEIAARQWGGEVSGFVVTGASKRGWTSWLTGVVDRRVVAIAPIVIDVLNFRVQMRYQLETWGKFSEQLDDYTRKGLITPEKLEKETPQESLLRQMMDPYTYRQHLRLPKLIINGTNDRYWVVDATRIYWHDLVGPKYLLEVPNAGHGLEGGRELALATLSAFFRHIAGGEPMPAVDWNFAEEDKSVVLQMWSDQKPTDARLWVASSETKDFREARWSPQPMQEQDGRFIGRVILPEEGYVALFGQFTFQKGGLPFALSTYVRRYPPNGTKPGQ